MKTNTQTMFSSKQTAPMGRHMFLNRVEAGKQLAYKLLPYKNAHPVIFGLPRGGVPVAYEIAKELETELDVLVVHKIGAPFNPEFAIGAVGEDGTVILHTEIIEDIGIDNKNLAYLIAEQQDKLKTQVQKFRGNKPVSDVHGRSVIIVDDGLATGATASAAVAVARKLGASRIIVAVPVGEKRSVDRLRNEADEVVCLIEPQVFYAVGEFYEDFQPTTDSEVAVLLDNARSLWGKVTATSLEKDVTIPFSPGITLEGHIVLPARTTSIVLFAHGSGSSRLSPRNQWVAEVLNEAGIGTLLFDLLTEEESSDRGNVFDIELLAARLEGAKEWVRHDPVTSDLSIGYFGASTGAAAALVAAAKHPEDVLAVVSRGGRPDLAGEWLGKVKAPTLLIVGGFDTQVLELNKQAQMQMHCSTLLSIVPGATHLFEEPGTLRAAADSAAAWFADYLTEPRRR